MWNLIPTMSQNSQISFLTCLPCWSEKIDLSITAIVEARNKVSLLEYFCKFMYELPYYITRARNTEQKKLQKFTKLGF